MCEANDAELAAISAAENKTNPKERPKLNSKLIELIEEIRQPLTVIMLLSDQEYLKNRDESSKNILSLVLKSAEEIKDLTDQIYELASAA